MCNVLWEISNACRPCTSATRIWYFRFRVGSIFIGHFKWIVNKFDQLNAIIGMIHLGFPRNKRCTWFLFSFSMVQQVIFSILKRVKHTNWQNRIHWLKCTLAKETVVTCYFIEVIKYVRIDTHGFTSNSPYISVNSSGFGSSRHVIIRKLNFLQT
jgi:hypothetical protein